MSWYDYAECQNTDPELFFPIGTTGPALTRLKVAKSICASCPVQAMCLAWAMLAGIEHGVWGGTSEEERRATRRRTSWQQHLAAPPAERQRLTSAVPDLAVASTPGSGAAARTPAGSKASDRTARPHEPVAYRKVAPHEGRMEL